MGKTPDRKSNAKGHREHWLHNKPQFRTEEDIRRWWGEVFPGHEGDMQPWQANLLAQILNHGQDAEVTLSGRRNGKSSVYAVAEHAKVEIKGAHPSTFYVDETHVFTDEQIKALKPLVEGPPKFPSYPESFHWDADDPLYFDHVGALRDEIEQAAEIQANRKWWDELMFRHQPTPVPIAFVRSPEPGPSNVQASMNYIKHRYGSIEEYYKLNWETQMSKKNKEQELSGGSRDNTGLFQTHTHDLSDPKPIPGVADIGSLYVQQQPKPVGPYDALKEKAKNQKKELRRLNAAIKLQSAQNENGQNRVKSLRALTVTQQTELAKRNTELSEARAEIRRLQLRAVEAHDKSRDEKRKRKQLQRTVKLLKADIKTP